MNDEARPDATPSESDSPETETAAAEETLAAAAADTEEQAADGEAALIAAEEDEVAEADESEEPSEAEPGPAPKLERLQKILAQAGIASRRHAEELITEGRVQVNGKVITELGTKADAARDHIRVDGKLLQGSERLRYYMLNKPKGFVTTVSDPEGRPTVMQFFTKSRERLYPVGRLDYLSEGLLLITNDGELANKLTRAASGVEKTYLVKVSGEPSEEELDRLRQGVGIDREKPGSGRVQAAPAQIRKVRQGDNPWYEVVLIEGRNRELRKMFEEIGHHVEKIRRVGYGPLVLDLEPGKVRELESEELEDLRKAADGKLRKPKAKDDRRRNALHAQLPTLSPRQGQPHAEPRADERPPARSPHREFPKSEFPPKKQFGAGRPPRTGGEGFRPRAERSGRSEHPGRGAAGFGSQRPGRPAFGKAPQRSERPQFGGGRPAWKKDDRAPHPSTRFSSGPSNPSRFGQKPPREDRQGESFAERGRPAGNRPFAGNRTFDKKPWKSREGGGEAFKPRSSPRIGSGHDDKPRPQGFKSPKPPRLHIEPVEPGQEASARHGSSRPPSRSSGPDRRPGGGSSQDRPGQSRPAHDRPRSDRPSFGRSGEGRASGSLGRTGSRESGSGRPARGEGNRSRPFTTSSGKPRPGGARPSNKRSGPPAAGKPAWKPKPGGAGRTSSGSGGRTRPAFGSKPGGSSRAGSGYKGKAGGGRKPGGPRLGGKRPSGKTGGKKRG